MAEMTMEQLQEQIKKQARDVVLEMAKSELKPDVNMETVKAFVEEKLNELPSDLFKGQAQAKYSGIYSGNGVKTDIGENKQEPGIKMARVIKARQYAKMNDLKPDEALKKLYGHDEEFVSEYKSLVDDARTKGVEVVGDGGYLVPEVYVAEIIPLLYAMTFIEKFAIRRVPLSTGKTTIPKRISGTDAKYVGEKQGKNAKNPKYKSLTLSSKTLMVKTVVSMQFIESTTFSADQYVRDDMVIQAALEMNRAMLFGSGSEYEPTGLDNVKGINSNKTTDAFVVDIDNQFDEFVFPVMNANADFTSPGWVFNAAAYKAFRSVRDGDGRLINRMELREGSLENYPVAMFNEIPVDDANEGRTAVYFGDWGDVIFGEQMAVRTSESDSATFTDENGDKVDAFDQNMVVIKMTMMHDWVFARPEVFVKKYIKTNPTV